MARNDDNQPKPAHSEQDAQAVRDAHYQEDGVNELGVAPDSSDVPEAQE